ncbi:hypothetical protein A9K71_20900 [Mesorhizobium sp. WSM3873]|nr:hypothetical protein A9K71_20900 [Mesorhizobium sp. WSM3873]
MAGERLVPARNTLTKDHLMLPAVRLAILAMMVGDAADAEDSGLLERHGGKFMKSHVAKDPAAALENQQELQPATAK